MIFNYVSESVSRDSGLGFEAGGVDILSNGLNSMGLGGRGFPSYGNQGFVNIHSRLKSFLNMMFNFLLRIPWRRFWWISRWPWKFTWFGTRLCNTWKDASIWGIWSIIHYRVIDNPDLVCFRLTKALSHCLQVLQVNLGKVHF